MRRLVFVSSIAAVGSATASFIDERTSPSPVDDYGRSKLEAETHVRRVLNGGATDWCILRPPLVYEAGNPGNFARLFALIATRLPLPFGAMINRRSFIFVENLADAICSAVRHDGAIGDAFVVSDGSDFSTAEFVARLRLAAGLPATLFAVPTMVMHALARLGDLLSVTTGHSIGFDSYSVDRLTRSLIVDSRYFRDFFSWTPPVEPARALEMVAADLKALAGSRSFEAGA